MHGLGAVHHSFLPIGENVWRHVLYAVCFQSWARNRLSGRGGDFAGGRGAGWLAARSDDFRRSGHRNGGRGWTLRRWGICHGFGAVWLGSLRLDCTAVEPEGADYGLSDHREPCGEHSRGSAAIGRGAEDQAATVSSIHGGGEFGGGVSGGGRSSSARTDCGKAKSRGGGDRGHTDRGAPRMTSPSARSISSLQKPRALRQGDMLAIFAPPSPPQQKSYVAGLREFRPLQFGIFFTDNPFASREG